jgi:hypothetical protein
MIRAIDQRSFDAVAMPRASTSSASAEELESHHVQVGIHEAAHLLESVGSSEEWTIDVHFELGESRTARG